MPNPRVAHRHPAGLLDIKCRAIIRQPLVLIVIVTKEPITLVLGLGRGLEMSATVIRRVDVLQQQPVGFGRPDPAPIPAEMRPANGNPGLTIQPNPATAVSVRRRAGR